MEGAQVRPLSVQPATGSQPTEQTTSPQQDLTFTREDLQKDTYVREAEPLPASDPPAEPKH